MKNILILNRDGTEAGSFDPQPLLEALREVLQESSSAKEAQLADVEGRFKEQTQELAQLRDIQRRLGDQLSTPEGFAELARSTHMFDAKEDSNLAFVTFAESLGMSHLVRNLTAEERHAALRDMTDQADQDEKSRIKAAVSKS